MSDHWQVVFDEVPFRFLLSRSPRQRALLLRASELLKSDPLHDADFQSMDASGRQLSIRGFRPFLVTYWLDASVKEVRVLEIELVDS